MDQRQGPLNNVDAKRAQRAALRTRREALSPPVRAAFSRRITDTLIALPEYRRASVVLAYMSMGAEFETAAFVRRVLADGKTLVLPRVNREAKRLNLFVVGDLDRDLAPGVWEIREPVPDRCAAAVERDIEFALVPGLAFDERGGRLGYGGGFYDRLLAGLQAVRVTAAFSVQVVEAVPMSEHDQYVDLIVTEDGPVRPQR
ncbi:MAG: 5-formyltetrahydrofolate cyclo-ligase [Burkholderiales bacterium]|nr:5-formyltetrahydrofolate cyclo-ligase [Burkholderiales bacterium]